MASPNNPPISKSPSSKTKESLLTKFNKSKRLSIFSTPIIQVELIPGVNTFNYLELKAALESLGYEGKNQTLYAMICDMEEEVTGPIDFGEFFRLITSRVSDKDTKESIHKLFNLFDEDKVGKISIANLRKVVR